MFNMNTKILIKLESKSILVNFPDKCIYCGSPNETFYEMESRKDYAMNKSSSHETVRKLIQQLERPAWMFWISPIKAARSIGEFGTTASEAVPYLIQHIRKAAERTNVSKMADKTVVHGPFADALVTIGSVAIKSLIKYFTSNQEMFKYSVIEIVARYGEKAVPSLVKVLQTGTNEAKASAAWAIESIGPTAQKAVPALNIALGKALKPDAVTHVIDKTGNIKKVEIRKEYTEADIAFLQSLHSHKNPKPFELRDHDVILACLAALGAIGTAAAEAKPTVMYAMKVGKDDLTIKFAAESTLEKIS
jgi:HEAT repeat protein